MKKIIVLLVLTISVALNIFLIVVNHRLEAVLDTSIQNTELSESTVSIVDTIYGRKYVVEVDTITGYAKIIGLRHSETIIEDHIK